MSNLLFAIDLGNRQIKTSDGENTMVIPTSLVRKADFQGYGDSKLKDFELYTINGESAYIGTDVKKFSTARSGLQTSTERYSNNQIFKFLAIASIAKYAKSHPASKKGNLRINLMAGLPSEDFRNNENVDNVRKIFKGAHEVIYSHDGVDEVIKFTIDNVNFVPQPYGSFLSSALKGIDVIESVGSEEDFARYDDYMDSKVAILDIGGGDLQIVYVEFGNFLVNQSVQLKMGSIELFNRIRNELNMNFNIRGDINIIESLVRKGIEDNTHRFIYPVNRRKEIDITEIVVKAIEEWSQSIIEEFQLAFRNTEALDFILVTGGGANLIDKDIVNTTFNKDYERTVFVENSELANVEGYIKRLQMLENEE